eukprot:5306203-Amphidinium_carterae.1
MSLVCRRTPSNPGVRVPSWSFAGAAACGPAHWTAGSGRHSSNPHFCRCGVGYVTDTGDRVGLPPWLPAVGLQS